MKVNLFALLPISIFIILGAGAYVLLEPTTNTVVESTQSVTVPPPIAYSTPKEVTSTSLRDTEPPSVPTGLAVVKVSDTQITLKWNDSKDNVQVSRYYVFLNGVVVGTTASRTYTQNNLLPGMVYKFSVTANDKAGNTSPHSYMLTFVTKARQIIDSSSAAVTPISIPGDVTIPIVSLYTPASGATVSGSATTVGVTASDNVGVTGVQFKLDGINLDNEDIIAPYFIIWNTILATNGAHTLTATARDAAGNQTTSTGVNVTVLNMVADTTPPTTPTSLTATPISSTQINLAWTASTDAVGVTGYRIYRNGTQITTSATNSYSNTVLSPSTIYSYTVSAYDAAGNASAQSTSVSATTLPTSDTTAPTISLTAPLSGATVSGTTVTLSASASDNTGVGGVQFKLDGSNLGTEDTTSPYSITWNTTSATNGTHTLTATARDAAGNQTTSTGVSVTVSNTSTTSIPTPPPSTNYNVTVNSAGIISPSTLTIAVNDTVIFTYTNPGDEVILTFTPKPPNNILLDHDTKTKSYTFLQAGTYTYRKQSATGTLATIIVN